LTKVSEKNIPDLKSIISKLQVISGTNIGSGMKTAFDVIKGRK
jgi:hypothetical protein